MGRRFNGASDDIVEVASNASFATATAFTVIQHVRLDSLVANAVYWRAQAVAGGGRTLTARFGDDANLHLIVPRGSGGSQNAQAQTAGSPVEVDRDLCIIATYSTTNGPRIYIAKDGGRAVECSYQPSNPVAGSGTVQPTTGNPLGLGNRPQNSFAIDGVLSYTAFIAQELSLPQINAIIWQPDIIANMGFAIHHGLADATDEDYSGHGVSITVDGPTRDRYHAPYTWVGEDMHAVRQAENVGGGAPGGEPLVTVNQAVSFQTIEGWDTLQQIGSEPLDGSDLGGYHAYRDPLWDTAIYELGLRQMRLELYACVAADIDVWKIASEGRSLALQNGTSLAPDGVSQWTAADWLAWWRGWRHTSRLGPGNTEVHHFTHVDHQVEHSVLPALARAATRGETINVWITTLAYFFHSASDPTGKYNIRDHPDRLGRTYAALFLHLREKYGWWPDGIEICNEPDTSNASWSATQTAAAALAVITAVKAAHADFTGVKLRVPGVTNPANAASRFDSCWNYDPQGDSSFPLRPHITHLSYHLYGSAAAAGTLVPVVLAANASQGATSISVQALSGAIPSGTVLDFGNGEYAITSASASASATSISVQALPQALSSGDRADVYISVTARQAINRRRLERGVGIQMSELNGYNIWKLIWDLTEARISSGCKLALAFPSHTDPPPAVWEPDGPSWLGACSVSGNGWQAGDIVLGESAKLLRNVTYYVRQGAVVKQVVLSNGAPRSIAFQNPGGDYVVVILADAADTVYVDGLPAGTYSINYGRGTQASPTSGDSGTNVVSWNQTLGGPQTVSGPSDAVQVVMPGAGVYTIYRTAPSGPRAPHASFITSPADGATVQDTLVLVSEAATHPDGAPVQYQWRRRPAGADYTQWTAPSTPQSSPTWNLDVTGLADGDYEYQTRTTDGTWVSAWSPGRIFSIQNSVPDQPPPAPVLLGPAGGTTVDGTWTPTWTQGADPDGDPVTNYIEMRATGSGDPFVRSGPVTSGQTLSVAALPDGTYDWRIVATDGLLEAVSSTSTIVVANTQAAPVLTIDGESVATHGVVLRRLPGWLRPHPREWAANRVHGQPGERVSNRIITGRPFTIEGWINGTSPADARSMVESFKWLVTRNPQPKDYIFGYDPTRLLRLEYQDLDIVPVEDDALLAQHFLFHLQLVAAEPFWRHVQETAIGGIGTTPVALPMGTAPPQRFRVRILGGSNHVLTARDYQGNIVAQVSFTGSNSGGQYLCIEMVEGRIYLNTTGTFGVGTKAASRWNGERLIIPDTAWWRPGQHMTLSCSSGTAEVLYTPCDE